MSPSRALTSHFSGAHAGVGERREGGLGVLRADDEVEVVARLGPAALERVLDVAERLLVV